MSTVHRSCSWYFVTSMYSFGRNEAKRTRGSKVFITSYYTFQRCPCSSCTPSATHDSVPPRVLMTTKMLAFVLAQGLWNKDNFDLGVILQKNWGTEIKTTSCIFSSQASRIATLVGRFQLVGSSLYYPFLFPSGSDVILRAHDPTVSS